jgi:predicted metal-binding membrane protein
MSARVDGTSIPKVAMRDGVSVWVTLALLGGLAWVATAAQSRSMGTGPGTMDMAFLYFVAMWVVMMAAMMLPAIGPMAAVETFREGRVREARVLQGLVFGAGFLLPWAAYGIAAFLALSGTGRLVETAPDSARWLGVAIFATAGLYQFSPWKLRAMKHCRTPMNPNALPGLRGAFASGIRDGAVCVGCCWAFMAILFAVGVMNLPAMVGLAAVIFAEKVLPGPRMIASLAGVVFLVLAVVAAFEPSLLPGLSGGGEVMPMGGMDSGGMDMGGM